MRPGAELCGAVADDDGRHILTMNGGLRPRRKFSITARLFTKLRAKSGNGALPTITNNATPCCMTALSSFGL
jgi:hypothetical protein